MADEDETLQKMVDDIKSGAIIVRHEEEALRLKDLAEQKYSSDDIKSALKYAKRALKLNPSLDGLPELITAFQILRTAATPIFPSSEDSNSATVPDYYRILQVERFSHINTIKKQYKILALSLHPDKNPFAASEEAFKVVSEAVRFLSDKIRRKEYDTRLRITMQSEDVEGAAETFWTACSTCRLLHQFERKYLGHSLMCPKCKKSFSAVEVNGDANKEEDLDVTEKNEGTGARHTRISARIQERVAKGGKAEKMGTGVKRKLSSVVDILERSGGKVTGNEGGNGGSVKSSRSMSVEKGRNLSGSDVVEGLRSKRGGIGIVQSERARRVRARKEETMTLAQMQKLAKKKLSERKFTVEDNEVNTEKLRSKGKMGGKQKDGEKEKEEIEKEPENEDPEKEEAEKVKEKEAESVETDTENDMETENEETEELGMEGTEVLEKEEKVSEMVKEKEKEKEDKEKEMVNAREYTDCHTVSEVRDLGAANRTPENNLNSETENLGELREGDLEIMLVEDETVKEKENGEKEKEAETVNVREKRERRRVSKYGHVEVVKGRTSEKHLDSKIQRLRASHKGNLEILPVEDSDFHDFDRDRSEKSFKKGQVWAVYDDDGGMPRDYVLIDEVVSVNPFQVTLSWLQFQADGNEELISWQRQGYYFSCGRFKVSRKVSIKYLNLFSHVVDCERAAREVYRIYPTKGSVWAIYNDTERVGDKRCFDIVVSLSTFSDIHGLSIAYLVKVDGFRSVFKRREVGSNAIVLLGKDDYKLFSHQIPAKKLSGEEATGLPKDCWELDPASLNPPLLMES